MAPTTPAYLILLAILGASMIPNAQAGREMAEAAAAAPAKGPAATAPATLQASASSAPADPMASAPAPAKSVAPGKASLAKTSTAAIVGGAANLADGILTVRGVSPTIVITSNDAASDGATSVARTEEALKKTNAPSMVLFAGTDEHGQVRWGRRTTGGEARSEAPPPRRAPRRRTTHAARPPLTLPLLQAVSVFLEVSDPTFKGDVLTAKAKVVPPSAVNATKGSPFAAAVAAPNTLLPASTTNLKASHTAILIGDVVASQSESGDKNGLVGAIIGWGLGSLAGCGLGCAIGGATIGWYG